MTQPHITRPQFPAGYLPHPTTLLTWDSVAQRLAGARNYWLCTVRPDGRPHAIPLWAVWVGEHLYFDGSPETRHARNIAANPHICVHLESGDEAVIVEGVARPAPAPSPELAAQLARAYAAKYAASGYAPEPTQWDRGGLYVISPRVVLAWTKFVEDPTKFVFESA